MIKNKHQNLRNVNEVTETNDKIVENCVNHPWALSQTKEIVDSLLYKSNKCLNRSACFTQLMVWGT